MTRTAAVENSRPKMKIMIHVQHLLGSGHVRRAARLAHALDDAGMAVVLASGGEPVAGLDTGGAKFVQLPWARATDATFSMLVNATGAPLDASWHTARAGAVMQTYDHAKPHALIIEMFPFGRRQFAFELLPLLDAARAQAPRPLIAASVRDIIIPSRKPGRIDEAIARLNAHFDHVIVHGDPAFLPLQQSYPAATLIKDKLVYTGYVAPVVSVASMAKRDELAGEIIVSAGGGAAGNALMLAALKARSHSRLAGGRIWRLLIGTQAPGDTLHVLRSRAADGVIVETARPDFPSLLRSCACSVSQAGYNSVVEIVQARARAVLVPFAQENEMEQTMRAQAMAKAGRAVMLTEDQLTPESLAAAVDDALSRPAPELKLDLNGAENTARFLKERLLHAAPT